MKEENNKQKHYLIYQITNLVNGKIYIGQHITTDIEDNYFGSGNLIRAAINKHGLENFEFKILIDLKNKEEMNLLEKMVVTEEFCKRDDVYNIKVGGDGGWDYVNKNPNNTGINHYFKNKSPDEISQIRLHSQNSNKLRILRMSLKELEEFRKKSSSSAKLWHVNHPGYFAGERNPMHGHVYTDETRRKMSINKTGSRNSQYGKMWICNDLTRESKTIQKTDQIPNGWRKGRICKK